MLDMMQELSAHFFINASSCLPAYNAFMSYYFLQSNEISMNRQQYFLWKKSCGEGVEGGEGGWSRV